MTLLQSFAVGFTVLLCGLAVIGMIIYTLVYFKVPFPELGGFIAGCAVAAAIAVTALVFFTRNL